MGIGSPLRSPVRSTAMGGAPRVRAASAAHDLLHCYRQIAHGVERRSATFDRAGTASRRRELFVGAETGASRLPHRTDSTEPRRGGARWSGMRGWEVAPRGGCRWDRFVVPMKGFCEGESSGSSSYGAPSGSAAQGSSGSGSPLSAGSNLLLHEQDELMAEEAQGRNQADLMVQETETTNKAEPSCWGPWGYTPFDILCCIFEKLTEPRRHWTAAAVCASWRCASFQVQRPMALSISSEAPLDPLPFQPVPLRLFIAEPVLLRNGRMQQGDRFGFHAPSALPTVQAGSRLIGSYQGMPLFVDVDGLLELPSVCGTQFSDLIASRYRLPVGVSHQHIYLGTIAEDKVAIATDSSLLLSRGTMPGVWYRTSLQDHKIQKVIGLTIAGGAVYLMDLERRIFRAEVHCYTTPVMIELQKVSNLPVRNELEKLWLIKWPMGGSIVCIRHTEVYDTYQWSAFDLRKERGAWAWVQKADLDGCAVFVNWCSGSIGFAVKNPERWGLYGDHIYPSYKGACCRINWVYQHRIMPREAIIWPCPVWMLASPSELNIPEACEMKSEE